MDSQKRGEVFARYVALELKGKIISRGYSAKLVAMTINRPDATVNRWLNGKREIPVSVFGQVAELIGVEPQAIIEDAYSRLCVEFGEADGTQYDLEVVSTARAITETLEHMKDNTSTNVVPLIKNVKEDGDVNLTEEDRQVASYDNGGEPEFQNG